MLLRYLFILACGLSTMGSLNASECPHNAAYDTKQPIILLDKYYKALQHYQAVSAVKEYPAQDYIKLLGYLNPQLTDYLSYCVHLKNISVGAAAQLVEEQHKALIHASLAGHRKVVSGLLSAGANPNIRTSDTGSTPLMLAATSPSSTRADVVKILLAYKANPSIRDTAGLTALDRAKKAGTADTSLLALLK